MTASRLLAITIENFKSLYRETRVDFGLLTVFLGRNNSGKSSITQALLLLKQTLELARVESPLHLTGYVSATNFRELISGWPDEDSDRVRGPKFSVEWSTWVDIERALEESGQPDLATLMTGATLPWLQAAAAHSVELFTRIDLSYAEVKGKIILECVELLSSLKPDFLSNPELEAHVTIERDAEGRFECKWNGQSKKKIEVDVHHFFPSLSINKRNVGPRDKQRSLAHAYNILFAQPIDGLELLLKDFSYLSSMRGAQPLFYPPATSPSDTLGMSGEFAAQLLYAHRDDPVHYLLPNFDDINFNPVPQEKPLSVAINEVLEGLGIETPLSIHEIEKVGFRLMFGKATLLHVGRGLTYLLPIVQLGLFSDPQRFRSVDTAAISSERQQTRVCAFEEPESHLHPKVQSRLAMWFVALARSSRQVIVETHSDHLVRRLRTLLAQSNKGSEIEEWLAKNIRVVSVSQINGETTIESSGITKEGGMEIWPPDFMDAAIQGEQAIYYAAMDKEAAAPEAHFENSVVHEDEDEPHAGN